MDYISIILIAICLAADAFVVSISCGLGTTNKYFKTMLKAGLAFGSFQGGMALIGYHFANILKDIIEPIDHWIAFLLLGSIGINMIKESRQEGCTYVRLDSFKMLLVLSIATSIDAFATGITISLLGVEILMPVLLIGIITLFLCMLGVYTGYMLGCRPRLQGRINLIGGLVLLAIGLKILIEHLFF